ncbi:bifunctional folylpolyglutamate synthase/dihydrofolate synthase [Candidatus Woesearchaeota archaeon]|nr:bifunctional folylpolyglutamate synthase/dihydrofolate synthase [Candidatus Woesearchaeota archaeon]
MTTYSQAMQYINSLEFFGIKLGLDNIGELCRQLGNPQLAYHTIHVAGTNGKGSVTAMCSKILRLAGCTTGMYTSPHLQTFRERMQVNGRLIGKDELVKAFETVKKESDRLKEKGMQATFFEFTTAMAFVHFRNKKCDMAVIETGLGGRLDATNVVKPLVAVITNIALEHTEYLGNTKEKIAMEKAGIIKDGSITVIGEQDEKIKQLLLNVCKERKSKAIIVGKDYAGEILLAGRYQKRNAAAAKAAIEALSGHGIKISQITIAKGIAATKWPGRLEEMQKTPPVILDGAHNPHGIETVAEYVAGKKMTLVIGISEDKNIHEMMRIIAPLASKIIVTKAKTRGASTSLLRKEAVKYCGKVEEVGDVKEAVKKAVREAEGELIMVAGSLFVVGEARGLWKKVEN